jgi:alpha-galactosidase
MIEFQNNIFGLHGDGFSCLLRVNAWGVLEQLHYGDPIDLTDAQALMRRVGLGWGSAVLLDDSNTGSCTDTMGLAWSGSGRGDYRESPLQIGMATDLRYRSYAIHEEIVPMTSGLPQALGDAETLEIVMEQPGLRLRLFFTVLILF